MCNLFKFLLGQLIFFSISLTFSYGSKIDLNMLNMEKPVEMVIMVTRHGLETAALATNSKGPQSVTRPQVLLELTNKGKMDQYNLGVWLRQKYGSLLEDKYSSQTVYAVSTSSDETIMSGMCLMAGLFPPKDEEIWNEELLWQPIPIHSYNEATNNLLISSNEMKCPNYWKEYEQMKRSIDYNRLYEKFRDLFEYIQLNTGNSKMDFQYLNYLFNYIKKQIIRICDIDRKKNELQFNLKIKKNSRKNI